MNFLSQSWRQLRSLRTTLNNLTTLEHRALSTAVDTAQETPQYDKLYKKLELEMRANEPAILKSYAWFVTNSAKHLGIDVEKSWPQRKSHKERHTLLKSAFVHKHHRVQYEIRTYFHFVHLKHLTQSTCETYLEYIERNLPEGIGMKVTKIEAQRIPGYMLEPPKFDDK